MLEFNEVVTREIETVYSGADFSRRRRASFDALDPRPGETILDIGCGNGLLTAELARSVGSTGRVVGIDPSVEMLKAARHRCRDLRCVELSEATAEALPAGDQSFEKVVAVQVLEYVRDLAAAVGEVSRVLKPGGRLVVADIHFDSWIWYTRQPALMERMMAAWHFHLVERRVPELLPAMLADVKFGGVRIKPVTICDHVLRPDGLAFMLLRLMRSSAVANGFASAAEAQTWADEQEELGRTGRFFFSLTQYLVTATKA